MGRVFSQHKVLLEAGFSYDQAALILQVSQQRKAGTVAAAAGMHMFLGGSPTAPQNSTKGPAWPLAGQPSHHNACKAV
jgi:hypothetical protein